METCHSVESMSLKINVKSWSNRVIGFIPILSMTIPVASEAFLDIKGDR